MSKEQKTKHKDLTPFVKGVVEKLDEIYDIADNIRRKQNLAKWNQND